jgi:hypothetical protein
MDEYAIRGRRRVWFIPPMPPTIEESPATMDVRMGELFMVCIRRKKGAIFWIVMRIHACAHGRLFITDGNH